jgi:general secretion pathway protein K
LPSLRRVCQGGQSAICNEYVNKKGSALIITLLIVTVLISLTVEFAYEVYIGTTALSNWSNAQKASLIAKSGQTLSSNYLRNIRKLSYTYLSEIYLPIEKYFGTDTLLIIKIEDENSKFNINSIIYPNGLTNEQALSSLKKLLEYLNINPSLAMAIADWIDPDHEPRLRDSEYNAKNSDLWSVDELKLIEGVDKKIFETISPFITVYGDRSNKININTAKLPVLVSLHNDMTETLAKRIIDYRESTPFENTGQVQNLSGMRTIGQLLMVRITVKSSNFRVISKATVNEITRIVESVMDTSMKVQYWREG